MSTLQSFSLMQSLQVNSTVSKYCGSDLSCPSMEHCLSNKLCAKLEIMEIKAYELIKTSFQEEAMGCTQVLCGSGSLNMTTQTHEVAGTL